MTVTRSTKADPEERFRAAVLRRLDVMITLAMVRNGALPSMTERIHLLAECGLSQREICVIVGKEPNYVGAVLKRRK